MAGKKLLLAFWVVCFVLVGRAQTCDGVMRLDDFRKPAKRQIIQIPDVNGFQTLKCDFHMHTVFSDGLVWPSIRVQEAWQEGLDVMAITDHIEYTPHAEDVAVNHNRPWELAKAMAAERNILFIKGVEVTRNTPPGHFNALFVDDASGYIEDRDGAKNKAAVMKAAEQDAFIFWNHPGWQVNRIEGSYKWLDFIDNLYQEKVLHGIEVINGFGFHQKALDWCVEKDLTVLGTSDIHNLVAHDYNLGGYIHRTMTLVFAKERTPEAVREALEEGRTVAWASKIIAGKEQHVKDLFHACVKTGKPFYSRDGRDFFEISNQSDLYFELELISGDATRKVTLFPRSSQVISAPEDQRSVEYQVVTAFVGGSENLVVKISLL